MLGQPELKKWAIFCTQRDRETCDQFLRMFKRVLETFNYPVSRPKVVTVKSQYSQDWIDCFK